MINKNYNPDFGFSTKDSPYIPPTGELWRGVSCEEIWVMFSAEYRVHVVSTAHF